MELQKIMLIPAALVRYQAKQLWTRFLQWNMLRSTRNLKREADRLCEATGYKHWVLNSPLLGRRIVSSREFHVLKEKGIIRKNATFIDLNREAVYMVDVKMLKDRKDNRKKE